MNFRLSIIDFNGHSQPLPAAHRIPGTRPTMRRAYKIQYRNGTGLFSYRLHLLERLRYLASSKRWLLIGAKINGYALSAHRYFIYRSKWASILRWAPPSQNFHVNEKRVSVSARAFTSYIKRSETETRKEMQLFFWVSSHVWHDRGITKIKDLVVVKQNSKSWYPRWQQAW